MFLFLTTLALGQSGKIAGEVTDAKGEAVIGASAVAKGSNKEGSIGSFALKNTTVGALRFPATDKDECSLVKIKFYRY